MGYAKYTGVCFIGSYTNFKKRSSGVNIFEVYGERKYFGQTTVRNIVEKYCSY